MSKKATVTFNDDYMILGAKAQAQEEGKTFSQYIEELVKVDLEKKLQHKIVAYYESGKTHIETHFYTEADLRESVIAYASIYSKKERDFDGDLLIGYEVYKHGELLTAKGATK